MLADSHIDGVPGSHFQRLSLAVTGRRVAPLMPNRRRPRTSTTEKVAPSAAERDDSSAWSAFIVYRDADGEESHRRITCRKLTGCYGEPELISAYCHERAAARSFRIDRIVEMVCVATGEVLDPATHFALLAAAGTLKLSDKALDALARTLVFMARCDGEYHVLEQRAIEEAFGGYMRRFGGDDRALEAAVAESARLAPDGEDLMAALRTFAQLPQGPQICRLVLDCGGSVIDADGRHHPDELCWALEVSDALKHIADRRG